MFDAIFFNCWTRLKVNLGLSSLLMVPDLERVFSIDRSNGWIIMRFLFSYVFGFSLFLVDGRGGAGFLVLLA